MKPPIYGLLLVGGESRRMGRDKALLSYHSETTQLERTAALLKSVCARTFISQREDQEYAPPAGTAIIHDSVDGMQGPLCGILSAMHRHPEAHWLVLACDLPNLETAALQKLICAFQERPPELTAYRSTYDGLPEPLCALYPAGSARELQTLAEKLGKSCPRKLLIVQEARLVEQDNPRSLDNINTTLEYEQTRL